MSSTLVFILPHRNSFDPVVSAYSCPAAQCQCVSTLSSKAQCATRLQAAHLTAWAHAR